MKNKKWALLVALLLVVCMALLGCNNKDDEEKPDDSGDQQQEEQQPGEEEEEPDDSPYGQYKQVCKAMQAIDSVTYKANQEAIPTRTFRKSTKARPWTWHTNRLSALSGPRES